MEQLREFLRHQYIGAIVIGLLAYQGTMSFFSTVSGTILLVVVRARTPHGVFDRPPEYQWDRVIPSVTEAVFCLGLAYLMLRWLYGSKRSAGAELPAESAE